MSMAARTGLAAVAASLTLGFCLAGAADAADPATKTWRKLNQVEDKYATYINQPGAAKLDGAYTVRLVILYKPGALEVGGKAVAWEEFPALTVDCMKQKSRRGERIRHAADGVVVTKDDDAAFRLFDSGSNEDDIAKAKCENQWSGKTFEFKDGPAWMTAARQNMSYVANRAPHSASAGRN